jgi:hypothetical protein
MKNRRSRQNRDSECNWDFRQRSGVQFDRRGSYAVRMNTVEKPQRWGLRTLLDGQADLLGDTVAGGIVHADRACEGSGNRRRSAEYPG